MRWKNPLLKQKIKEHTRGMESETSILILDDDSFMLEFSKRLLAKAGLNHVVTTEFPEECVLLALSERFDLILMDYVLGDRTGAEVAAEVRSKGNTESKIIGLTANLRSDVAGLCETSGMNGVLEKPLKVQELKKAYLDAGRALQTGVLAQSTKDVH